ncbi:unnamed protein product [Zymoseptoria tritici ST99CH_3D1]|nr:unnamed protein product [Zymoseptoria tritici ST99CH_3D1]
MLNLLLNVSSESSPPHNHHHYRTLLFFHPPTAQNAVHTGLCQPSDSQAHSTGRLLKFEANAARLRIALHCSARLAWSFTSRRSVYLSRGFPLVWCTAQTRGPSEMAP